MDRKEDGLKALGAKTQYRMDYAPEVLETFVNKHPGNDYWYVSTALSLHRSALLRDSQISQRFASAIFLT